MHDHETDEQVFAATLTATKAVAQSLAVRSWRTFVTDPIASAAALTEGRVRAAIDRIRLVDAFLEGNAGAEASARQTRSRTLAEGWAWLAALHRFDPAAAGTLAANLAEIGDRPDEPPAVPPEEIDLAELSDLDAACVVLSLAAAPMRESEIEACLEAAGRTFHAGELRAALEQGRDRGDLAMDPATVGVGMTPKWTLAASAPS